MTACQIRDEIARGVLYSLAGIVTFVSLLRYLEARNRGG